MLARALRIGAVFACLALAGCFWTSYNLLLIPSERGHVLAEGAWEIPNTTTGGTTTSQVRYVGGGWYQFEDIGQDGKSTLSYLMLEPMGYGLYAAARVSKSPCSYNAPCSPTYSVAMPLGNEIKIYSPNCSNNGDEKTGYYPTRDRSVALRYGATVSTPSGGATTCVFYNRENLLAALREVSSGSAYTTYRRY